VLAGCRLFPKEECTCLLTCEEAKEGDNAKCRVYCVCGRSELLWIKQAARKGGRWQSAPYCLQLIDLYSHVHHVQLGIHTTFVTPMAMARIPAMILIVHLKLKEI
jgi:hypothetical protein